MAGKKNLSTIVLDLSRVSSTDDLHELVKTKLNFPSYYGRNWDAFWDCVTDSDQSRMPDRLVVRGWSALESRLPRDARLLRECLEDLKD